MIKSYENVSQNNIEKETRSVNAIININTIPINHLKRKKNEKKRKIGIFIDKAVFICLIFFPFSESKTKLSHDFLFVFSDKVPTQLAIIQLFCCKGLYN